MEVSFFRLPAGICYAKPADAVLARLVEEMSGGTFTIKVESKEKHKAALGILDMVKGGQYQMGHSAKCVSPAWQVKFLPNWVLM